MRASFSLGNSFADAAIARWLACPGLQRQAPFIITMLVLRISKEMQGQERPERCNRRPCV